MKRRNKAFSLAELSIVILIIGVLLASIGQGIELYEESRLESARQITTSSRVNAIPGLELWYETSLEESFPAREAEDGTVISQWNDIKKNGRKLNAFSGQKTDSSLISYNGCTEATAGNTSGPTYIQKGIDNLPTLRFTNSDSSFRYLAVDEKMQNITNGDMTLFMVVRYRSGFGELVNRVCDTNGVPGNGGCSGVSTSDGKPLFGVVVQNDGSLELRSRSDGANNFPSFGAVGYDTGYDLTQRDYILTFEREYNKNFAVYVNGNSSYHANSTKADNGNSVTLDPFKIGRHHNAQNNETLDVDISEFIFFAGRVKTKDRERIEDYLGKKYKIKVTH